MKKGVWVVTASYNDYDQHGEYFLTFYFDKPTEAQLKKSFPEWGESVIEALLAKGQRNDGYEFLELCEKFEGEAE